MSQKLFQLSYSERYEHGKCFSFFVELQKAFFFTFVACSGKSPSQTHNVRIGRIAEDAKVDKAHIWPQNFKIVLLSVERHNA